MEDNKDLVSVIVPVYKVEKYLDRSVKSIREQTYKELEIILVDDGSPDSCGRMCDEYAAADDRIKVIHKSNGGLSDARNAGIEASTGKWIVFVDSDDYISTDMIAYLKGVAEENSADIAWCRYKETGADEEDAAFDSRGTVEEIYSGRNAEYLFYQMGMMGECMVAWNKIYSKSLFEGMPQVRYPYGKIFEDGYTTYRLIYKAERVVVTDAVMYAYRQRSDSIMQMNGDKNYHAAFEAGEGKLLFFSKYKEEELYRLELNLLMHSVINFYENSADAEGKKEMKEVFDRFYRDYFVKEKWPLGKKIRMKAFYKDYGLYTAISKFEGLYNTVTGKK